MVLEAEKFKTKESSSISVSGETSLSACVYPCSHIRGWGGSRGGGGEKRER